MKVIKPTTFDKGTMLVSTTATEATSDWNSGTTYNEDDEVHYGDYIWVSLQDSNTNNQPDTSPTWWFQKMADNLTAMFDTTISTPTTASTSLEVVVDTGLANSAAFLDLVGQTLTVEITDGDGGPVVYSEIFNLDGTIILDWYDYFFEPYDQLSDIALTNLPPYSGSRMTMTLESGGDVAIGEFVFGNVVTLGLTQYNAGVGIKDYSIKDVDEFGITRFVERNFSKRMNANVFVDNNAFNKVQKTLTALRATPSVFIGSEDERFAPTIIFGYYRDYDCAITYPTYSLLSIEIEGLV